MSQPTEKPLCKTLGCIFERDHLGDHSFALRSSRSSSPAPAPTATTPDCEHAQYREGCDACLWDLCKTFDAKPSHAKEIIECRGCNSPNECAGFGECAVASAPTPATTDKELTDEQQRRFSGDVWCNFCGGEHAPSVCPNRSSPEAFIVVAGTEYRVREGVVEYRMPDSPDRHYHDWQRATWTLQDCRNLLALAAGSVASATAPTKEESNG